MSEPPELTVRLSEELRSEQYECPICSELIRRQHKLWSCAHCHKVFHLHCINNWVLSQKSVRADQLRRGNSFVTAANVPVQDDFCCPLCQALNPVTSTRAYYCYCGKVREPAVDAMLVPGSCGGTCERRRPDPLCPHRCPLMCHPGPCPACGLTREQACYCGKHSKRVGCSSEIDGYSCTEVCGRVLDCGVHHCTQVCHSGPCAPCAVMQELTCFCGATRRLVGCAVAQSEHGFRCGQRCHKLRDCGVHECGLLCHDGPCEVCWRMPGRQRFCPCGKSELRVERTACTDPIPSCGQPCEMPLPCGHLCWYTCHDSAPCAPCKEMIEERCRCGAKTFTFPCFCTYLEPMECWPDAAAEAGIDVSQLPLSYPPLCQKVCNRLLSCGKHRCTQVCCADTDHICLRTCHKRLACGQHTCGQLCHAGPCPPCAATSSERLYCRCRRTWIEPPVPCGTPSPACPYPCIIPRPCGHPANHTCHASGPCPKCTMLVPKLCASHQRPMMYHMPCHLTDVSCGMKCKKMLPCCGKTCELVCHGGPCVHKCPNTFPNIAEAKKPS